MSLVNLFGGLRRLLRRRSIQIDNCVFRLHWLVTSSVLVVFSLVVTARQYVGDPIECVPPTSDFPMEVLNTYCWIHSTFTIPAAFSKKVGYDVPHPGIDNAEDHITNRRYNAYYQWVYFMLFFQAILFYVPYYIWKNWEGGLLEAITMGMQVVIMEDQERDHKKRILTEYLHRHMRHHKFYALKYIVCEFLSLVNIIGQMFLMDKFLGGEFWRYGTKVVSFAMSDQEDRSDPMIYVFPRMTKCTFRSFGSSGDIQSHDSLCLLPLNVVNEKIYIFLWFWFIILVTLTSFVFVLRIVVLMVPKFRFHMLKSRSPLMKPEDLEVLSRVANAGDWFLFYMLAQNLDPLVYKEVVSDLTALMEGKVEEARAPLNSI
uniref:Innexin n=1 Tax=Ixodes ricinus TaxID=34613 RepID=A0A0K8RDF6_IXORI